MTKESLNKKDLDLIARIRCAINLAIENEIALLKHGRVERNFTTNLANQISAQLEIENIKVDPFYNKHLGASKRLNGELIEVDVAVHERDTDRNNLILIELETVNKPKRDDVWKVEGMTTHLGGYGYKLGLYLVVGIKKKAGEIVAEEWYKNGQIIEV